MYDDIKDLDEAKAIIKQQDTIIGRLTREVNHLRKIDNKRNGWLLEAKEEAGFSRDVSFDVVWKEMLKVYKNE